MTIARSSRPLHRMDLQRPKATKPRTAKTLSSAIAAFFQKQLSDEEIAAIIAAMQGIGCDESADFDTSSTSKVRWRCEDELRSVRNHPG
jgi:hypothetical protein